MKYGLSEININKIINVFRQFPEIETALLYGSRAKGNYRPSSDIDLTLKGRKLNLQVLSSIIIKLDDLLLPYRLDISIYSQINNPELLDHIHRVGKTFYQPE
jgi:predicted nucleotidyltransferase